jgi:hypothetical protein
VITIGQVGLGHWGPNLLRNFMSLPDSRVKLCCDIDAAARVRAADSYPNLETTADYGHVLEDGEIEAVVVSSPASLHYEHARLAIEHDKHLHARIDDARVYGILNRHLGDFDAFARAIVEYLQPQTGAGQAENEER